MQGFLNEALNPAPEPSGPTPEQIRQMEEQRILAEQRHQEFLRSNSELSGKLKGTGHTYVKNENISDTGSLKLKTIAQTQGNTTEVYNEFFGQPVADPKKVELLRGPTVSESDFAEARLNQPPIDELRNKTRDNPVSASDYLYKLQTRQLSTVSVPATPPIEVNPQVWDACSDPALHGSTIPLTPERRAFLGQRLQEARDRLKYINTALKKLIEINASQRAEIEKTTKDISAAYDESVDRAWSVVFDLLTSLPADKFVDNYTTAASKLEDEMKYRTGLLTTPLDAAAKQEIQSEISLLQTIKARLEDIYKRSTLLLDVFKGANYAYDIDKWNQGTKDEYTKIREGALLIGRILLDHPKLEAYLKTKSFFAAEKYWQVLAMGRMAYYGTGFFLDILAQKIAWEPLTGTLQNDLKNNIQAMENLRQKAENTYREIGCIGDALRMKGE